MLKPHALQRWQLWVDTYSHLPPASVPIAPNDSAIMFAHVVVVLEPRLSNSRETFLTHFRRLVYNLLLRSFLSKR